MDLTNPKSARISDYFSDLMLVSYIAVIIKVLGDSCSEIWISRKPVGNVKSTVKIVVYIPQNNVDAHNLLPTLFKLFDEKLLMNINFKIIERVSIVALLIFRVNLVSILSTLEQVYSHIYLYSFQRKWNYDFLETVYVISKFKIQNAVEKKSLHLIWQNKFQYVLDPFLHSSQTA